MENVIKILCYTGNLIRQKEGLFQGVIEKNKDIVFLASK